MYNTFKFLSIIIIFTTSPECHSSIVVAVPRIPRREYHVLIHLDDPSSHNRLTLYQACLARSLSGPLVLISILLWKLC